MPGALPNFYPAVLSRRSAEVAKLSKGPRGRGTAATTGSGPMAFPRIPQGDIIHGAPICELCQRPGRWGVAKFR
jgi:hypothetical protein